MSESRPSTGLRTHMSWGAGMGQGLLPPPMACPGLPSTKVLPKLRWTCLPACILDLGCNPACLCPPSTEIKAGNNGVWVTPSQGLAHAQELGDWGGGRDFCPQWRHTQAYTALISCCLGGGGRSRQRHAQTGAGRWGHRGAWPSCHSVA